MPTEAQLKAERWYVEEITTPELKALGSRLCQALGVGPNAFGAKGNTVHLNGGHRSQAWIENSRWCTNRTYATEAGLNAEEKRWIAAFDLTPATRAQMLRISQNIDAVTRAGQLEELVEWYGNTNDDRRVDGWDNIRNAVATSDPSHLWHLHGRLRRKVMRDRAVMDRVFNAVVNGTGGNDMDFTNADENAWTQALRVEQTLGIVKKVATDVAAIKAAQSAPVPVTVDATAVAAALKADASLLAAIAKAVNDDDAKRGAE